MLTRLGFWMYFVGVLVLQSRYAPRALGYLLIAAGAAYVTDTAANTLLGNCADYETLFIVIVAVPSIIAEGWLEPWLLLRAGNGRKERTIDQPVDVLPNQELEYS